MTIQMRDKKTGVIININPEAFDEKGQDINAFIKKMKNSGFELFG